ncbi:MAG: hypothetical protein CMA34_03815 [Euryarchaeota archaeon]|nr:hypothetical protein [Euryarchaeota archaeon]|tara:strand:- start:226 stop:675 length:450 start_codon:yes stop_codon:yes gene_type:complete
MAKKKLSKGFEDLFSQNETDLSFLDAYGKTNLENVPGLPESSQNHQNSDELFDAILRLFKSEKVSMKSTKKKISLGKFLLVHKKNNQIEINIKSERLSLPLVQSDLMSPGFSDSHLSEDSMNCSVIIDSWGIATKNFISRIIEFYKNNY